MLLYKFQVTLYEGDLVKKTILVKALTLDQCIKKIEKLSKDEKWDEYTDKLITIEKIK